MHVRNIVILAYLLCSIGTLEYKCQCCNCCNEEAPIIEEEIKRKEEERKKKEEEEILTEEEIKKVEECYGEQKEITPTKEGVLQHLKLDEDKLDNIINEVNNAGDNIAKIEKIIEYSKDIDWDNPMCPNTLIKWENNACFIISHFNLMLNNPYFLKFFLICDKIESLHGKDTYMLNAICEVVKWCVEHPEFNKNNMGSVEPILKALFIKEKDDEEYFYCKKEKERILGNDLYTFFNTPYKGSDGRIYYYRHGSFLPFTVCNNVNTCLYIDLGSNIDEIIIENCKLWAMEKYYIGRIFKYISPNNVTLTNNEKLEKKISKIKKLLGISLVQYKYHIFTLINYNGIWYNKNTLNMNECKKMSIPEVLGLLNNVFKIKDPKDGEFVQSSCNFEYIKNP